MQSSLGVNRASPATGDQDFWMSPRLDKQNGVRRGAEWCHGGLGLVATLWDATNYPGSYALIRALSDADYVVAGTDMSGSGHWGNATAQARLGQSDTWIKTPGVNSPGAKNAPLIVFGISMGATAAINYYGYDGAGGGAGHVANIAALVLILPALNLDYVYQNNIGGTTQAAIGTAWGVTYPTALPAHADPQSNMTLIAAAAPPTRIYYATDDSIQDATKAAANLAALGGNGSIVSLGANGHTETAINQIDRVNLVQWLRSVAP